MSQVDCVIVGGGPAGLTAALYLARFRRSVVLLDSGTSRAKLIRRSHNCPGFVRGISGQDYLDTLRKQLAAYSIDHRAETVVDIQRAPAGHRGGFVVRTYQNVVKGSQVLLEPA